MLKSKEIEIKNKNNFRKDVFSISTNNDGVRHNRNKKEQGFVPRIGEVYLMEFTGDDNEQKGVRPGVVFQNNTGNKYSPNIIALPLTTSLKKLNQPTHVFLPKEVGLVRDSMVLCENPQRMSKRRIGTYITTLPKEYMAEIARANMLATAGISFIDLASLPSVKRQAIRLNAA